MATSTTVSIAPSSPEFGKLKSFAQELMSQKEWSASSLISLGGSLAAEVNHLVALKGSQKKQLVLDVVKAVLQESVAKSNQVADSPLASEEMVKSLKFVLDYALPASLDLAVAASRGQIDLKKVKASAFSSCLTFLPSLVGLCGVSQKDSAKIVAQVAKKADPQLLESYKSSSPSEVLEGKTVKKETPPLQSIPEGAVVVRVPEATPPPHLQSV